MTKYLLFASPAGIPVLSNQISYIVYSQLMLTTLTVSSDSLGRTNVPLRSRDLTVVNSEAAAKVFPSVIRRFDRCAFLSQGNTVVLES